MLDPRHKAWNQSQQALRQAAARCIPPAGEHSVAWLFWHIARIEDVTMNVLVAARRQLLLQDGWLERLKVADRHTGNAMPPQAVADLSAALDLEALRAYRLAVGRQTRQIKKCLSAY
jgi:hypothetical protein